MAIDFYEITDTKKVNRLFAIEHHDFDLLENILVDFKRLTGVYFDAYRDTRIYKKHIDIIADLLRKELAKMDIQKREYESLSIILGEFLSFKSDMIAIGD